MTVSGARRPLDERFHTAANHDAATHITHQWLPLLGGHMDIILGSSRRSVLAAGLAVSASWLVGRSQAQTNESVMTRPIPHSGEQLPIVGLGTAVSFPSANESQRAGLKDVIDALVAGGGKLIDTMYGPRYAPVHDGVFSPKRRRPAAKLSHPKQSLECAAT